MKTRKTREVAEYGDFQTPPELAKAAVRALQQIGISPNSILEPTCGKGAFVAAASAAFPAAETIIGVDINRAHLAVANEHVGTDSRVSIQQRNFFDTDWQSVLSHGKAPWLIIGNPPWVTNAELGALASENLPEKSNFHGLSGIDAITGKSNFDISEWMLLRYLDWLENQTGAIAVLCKSAVARKIMRNAWKRNYPVKSARIYEIDALAHFDASVHACFFVLEIEPGSASTSCEVFDDLGARVPTRTIGYLDKHLISDIRRFERQHELLGPEQTYVWRSGIKHDCSKVMELKRKSDGYLNGFGETVDIEDEFLFPMLKSSDVANDRDDLRNVMLVTQTRVGEDTSRIRTRAPQTWSYLQRHSQFFEGRASSIYRNKPPFSIFGVGDYSFAPWKLAISGFYKKLHFKCIGPSGGRPTVLDDTVYFLPCTSEAEVLFLHDVLTSPRVTEFFQSMISWDEKRPITVDMLRRLSLKNAAAAIGKEAAYFTFTSHLPGPLFMDRNRVTA